MPGQEGQVVETLGEQASGPHTKWDHRPDVNEVVQALQNQISQLALELAVTKLSLAKALTRIQGLEAPAHLEHPESPRQ